MKYILYCVNRDLSKIYKSIDYAIYLHHKNDIDIGDLKFEYNNWKAMTHIYPESTTYAVILATMIQEEDYSDIRYVLIDGCPNDSSSSKFNAYSVEFKSMNSDGLILFITGHLDDGEVKSIIRQLSINLILE